MPRIHAGVDELDIENIKYLAEHILSGNLRTWQMNKLVKWHFNVFDLPESDYINAAESKVYEPKNK